MYERLENGFLSLNIFRDVQAGVPILIGEASVGYKNTLIAAACYT